MATIDGSKYSVLTKIVSTDGKSYETRVYTLWHMKTYSVNIQW
ncbi:MAG: hypothetical protein ACFFKA_14110 [Candidatus Thorarchaeota archaeon]